MTPVKVLLCILLGVAIWRIGYMILRGLAQPIPEPPPPGDLRKVNLRYRCAVCGTELKMTLANDELPDPPRHCLEDMDLVAPPIE